MTPDQLTRLTALLAKETLTGSENKELAFLKSIATPAELSQASGEEEEEDDDDEEEDDEEEKKEDGKQPADPQSGKPSALDHAKALASSKASLVKRNGELSARVGSLTAQNQQLSATIAANAKTIGDLQTELATLKGELAQEKATNKSLSGKVSEELAGLGVKDKDLPPPSKSDKNRTYASQAEVNTALEAATTFEEKAAILDAWEKSQSA